MPGHEEGEDFMELFDRKGYWQDDHRPSSWGDPQVALREVRFWQVFEACLDGLPRNQARVFMMREFVDMDSQEICTAVDITVSNLNVMLHRARLRLSECLKLRWIENGDRE